MFSSLLVQQHHDLYCIIKNDDIVIIIANVLFSYIEIYVIVFSVLYAERNGFICQINDGIDCLAGRLQ